MTRSEAKIAHSIFLVGILSVTELKFYKQSLPFKSA
jgi:hypothetical protein